MTTTATQSSLPSGAGPGRGDMKALDEASDFDLGYPYEFLGRVQSRW